MILRYSPTGIGPYGGDYPDERPRTRGECMSMPRPCPFVSCRYHLAVDAHRDRESKHTLAVLNDDPCSMEHTCALDIADGYYKSEDALDGEAEEVQLGYGEIATLMSDVVSWQRIQQTISSVQAKIRKASAQELEDYHITPKDDEATEVPRWMKLRGLVMAELSKGPRSQERLAEALAPHGFTTAEITLTLQGLPNVKVTSAGTMTDEAVGELTTMLSQGPMVPAHAIAQVCGELGCSRNTVERAARLLGALSTRGGRGHLWTLPTKPHTEKAGVVKRYGRTMLSLVGGKANPRHPGHAGKAGRSD